MKLYAEINLQNKIVPLYDSDYEVLKKLRKNTPLAFEIKQERNYKFLKKFFALLNLVYENQEMYTDIEDLRSDLTIEAGYYVLRYNIHGEEIKKAKSISFAKMEEAEFSELYNKIIDVIVKYFNFDRQDIMEHIEQFF